MNCDFVCADILDYSSDTRFDLVFFSWSLYQTDDMEKAIKNAKKLLSPNGQLIILQPISGDQDKIFDIEVKRTNRDYTSILDIQLSICERLFPYVYTKDIVTEFVYPSIDSAIQTNAFFYDLFSCGINDDIRLELKQRLISRLKSDGLVHLSDVTKMIRCSYHESY